MHARPLAVVLSAILICAGFALPATAGAKPAASLEFAFPEQGGIGFNHMVVKAKKGKPVRGKRARRAKRKATKLGKGVSAMLKLRPKQTPERAQIAARVARIGDGKKLVGIDVAVLQAGEGARLLPAGAAGGGIPPAAPKLDVELFLRRGGGDLLRAKSDVVTEEPDDDVTGSDPNRDDICADFGKYQPRQLIGRRTSLLDDIAATLDAIDLAQRSYCDQPLTGGLDSLFTLLDLDQPPLCTPNLAAAPAPNPNNEIVVRIFCRQPATSIGFEIPGKRVPQAFIPPRNLPNCGLATVIASGNKAVICDGGTLPANTVDSLQVRPDRPLACDDKVRTYFNPKSQASPAILDTQAFATCP